MQKFDGNVSRASYLFLNAKLHVLPRRPEQVHHVFVRQILQPGSIYLQRPRKKTRKWLDVNLEMDSSRFHFHVNDDRWREIRPEIKKRFPDLTVQAW